MNDNEDRNKIDTFCFLILILLLQLFMIDEVEIVLEDHATIAINSYGRYHQGVAVSLN